MAGVVVFSSVAEAIRAGYEVEQPPTPIGYDARIRTASGWARALVVLKDESK